MNPIFKCLFIINEDNYRIIINNNCHSIVFKDAFNELLKYIELKDISLETHLFELLDIDFNEYVVISSDDHLIPNLSRIRVSLKPEFDRNSDEDNSSFYGIENRPEVEEQTHETNDNCLESNDSFESIITKTNESNELSINESKKVKIYDKMPRKMIVWDENNEVINEEKQFKDKQITKKFNKTIEVLNEIQINDRKEVFDQRVDNESDLSDDNIEIVESSEQQMIRCGRSQTAINGPLIKDYFHHKRDSILLDIIQSNAINFNTNNHSLVWQSISLHMINYGFKEFSPVCCEYRFLFILKDYFKILWSGSDFHRASTLFPLFHKLNLIDITYPFLFFNIHSTHNDRRLMSTKIGNPLVMANNSLTKAMNNLNRNQLHSSSVRTRSETSFPNNSSQSLPVLSVISEKSQNFENRNSVKVSDNQSSEPQTTEQSNQVIVCNNNVIIESKPIQSKMQKVMELLRKRKELINKNNSENQTQVKRVIDQSVEGINSVQNSSFVHQLEIPNYFDQKRDSALVDIVFKYCQLFEKMDHLIVWETVNYHMIKSGFVDSDAYKCMTRFVKLIDFYFGSQTQISGLDLQIAINSMPLYSKLRNIDNSYPFLLKRIPPVVQFFRDLNSIKDFH